MSLGSRTRSVGTGAALFSFVCLMGWAYAQRGGDSVAPEKLLPARSILYIKGSGSLLTSRAFKETACYKSLYESGLVKVFEDVMDSLPSDVPHADEIEEAFRHVEENGLSISITDGQGMQPWGLIVFHDAVGGVDFIKSMIDLLPGGAPDIQDVTIQGRVVTMTMIPNTPVEVGWWEEQGHLLVAVGLEAIRSAIAVAEGEQPNLTTNPLYTKYAAETPDFAVNSIGWFDFATLQKTYGGIPIPVPGPEQRQIPINQILTILGLHNFDHVFMHSGFKGESLWSEQIVKINGEATGLMELVMQENFSLEDLPPLPVGQSSLVAASLDWEGAYNVVWEILTQVAEFGPPDALEELEEEVRKFESEVGFSPKKLLSTLGNVHCLYADSQQGLFGLGGAMMISVKDADELANSLNAFFKVAEKETRGDFVTQDIRKRGRIVTLLQFPEAPFLTPALCVDDDWLIVALVPQAIEAALMRMDGELPKWEPGEKHKQAFAALPKEFTSLTVIDPADTYRFLLGFAPMALGGLELFAKETGEVPDDFRFPVTSADFPPNEVVLRPLFPNVIMSTVEGDSIHTYARQSLPGLPFLGGGGDSTTTIAASAIGIALLLPAVQSAREAARRTQSKNNIKQIMLALHNYHDVHRNFPQGTVPNKDLKPEKRLSWLVSILPYIDEAVLYQDFDQKAAWDEGDNEFAATASVDAYVHPSNPEASVDGYGTSSYLGLAGVGANGPNLPVNDPKAGVFGYNRATGIRDIHDGTSNTLMVGEAEDPQPWAAGGPATIRPLVGQPYINGGNGYGSRSPGGANFGLADGSVRFISENIDPGVLEALTTIRGGEVIGDF